MGEFSFFIPSSTIYHFLYNRLSGLHFTSCHVVRDASATSRIVLVQNLAAVV